METKKIFFIVTGFLFIAGFFHSLVTDSALLSVDASATHQTAQTAQIKSSPFKTFFGLFPSPWGPELCPSYNSIVPNGGFEDGLPPNSEDILDTVNMSNFVCGWLKTTGAGFYHYSELNAIPWYYTTWSMISGIYTEEREQVIGSLVTVQHVFAHNGGQTHQYLIADLGDMVPGQTYELSFDMHTRVVSEDSRVGLFAGLISEETFAEYPQFAFGLGQLIQDGQDGDYGNREEFLAEFGEYFDQIIYLSETNDMEDTNGVYIPRSFEFVYEDEDLEYLVLMPVGYAPNYSPSDIGAKVAGYLSFDNVAIEPVWSDLSECAVTSLGVLPVYYVNQQNEVVLLDTNEALPLSDIGEFSNQAFAEVSDEGGFGIGFAGEELVIDSFSGDVFSLEELETYVSFVDMDIIDVMGFSGGQHFVSFLCVLSCESPYDLDENGVVDAVDVTLFSNEFFETICESPYCAGDFDGNGIVNQADLLDLLFHMGDTCAEDIGELRITSNGQDVTKLFDVSVSLEDGLMPVSGEPFNYKVSGRYRGGEVLDSVLFSNLVPEALTVVRGISTIPSVEFTKETYEVLRMDPRQSFSWYFVVEPPEDVCALALPRPKRPPLYKHCK